MKINPKMTMALIAVAVGCWIYSSTHEARGAELQSSIGIFAHVDDAELFGGSSIHKVDRVYIAAMPMRVDQMAVMEAQGIPYQSLWGTHSLWAWENVYNDMEAREQVYTYDAMAAKIRQMVGDHVRFYGLEAVYTHNPWGEYGHVHHRRVSEAVVRAAMDFGIDVWASAAVVSVPGKYWYEDSAGLPERVDYLPEGHMNDVQKAYAEHEPDVPGRMWTWFDDLEPPAEVTMIQLVRDGVDLRGSEVRSLQESIPESGR